MEWNIEAKPLRENILRAPGLYIGRKLDTEGLHFLVLEIVKLAVQPDSSNECSAIDVVLEETGEITIADNGKGLPVERVRLWNGPQKPKIEHVLTWIWERHPNRQYYEQFGFLNYLGAVLNAVSLELQIKTNRNGHLYLLNCSQGRIVKYLREIENSGKQGTELTFLPDPEVFINSTFYNDMIVEGLQKIVTEHPHVLFSFYDKRSGKKLKFPLE